jgi:hypothetical protein
MRRAIAVAVLLGAGGLAACSSTRVPPRPPIHHAVAAIAVKVGRSMVDMAEVVAWRAPKLLLYELPGWLFYRGPRDLVLALSPRSERVAALVEALGEGSEETRLETVTELRALTGLPLEDAAAWRAWWRGAADRPDDRWAADFADACLVDLESEDFLVRQAADERLRDLAGRDVGYDAKGSAKDRQTGVERWKAWRAETYGPGGDAR